MAQVGLPPHIFRVNLQMWVYRINAWPIARIGVMWAFCSLECCRHRYGLTSPQSSGHSKISIVLTVCVSTFRAFNLWTEYKFNEHVYSTVYYSFQPVDMWRLPYPTLGIGIGTGDLSTSFCLRSTSKYWLAEHVDGKCLVVWGALSAFVSDSGCHGSQKPHGKAHR